MTLRIYIICRRRNGNKMIIGEPYNFAIIFDTVDGWNNDANFKNGILFFGINDTVFPTQFKVITLSTELWKVYRNLQNIVENKIIFNMKKEDAFKSIFRITYPENFDTDNDYRYLISPDEINDSGNFIFALRDGDDIRILSSSLEYDIENSTYFFDGIKVIEGYIKEKELEDMLSVLKDWI